MVEFTAMEYGSDSTLYIATDNGKVSAWDTRHNSCFMHWEADSTEIGMYLDCIQKILSEYEKEITQSQTADNPMAPRGRATQQS